MIELQFKNDFGGVCMEYMGEKTGRKKGLESRHEGTVGKVRAYSTVPVSP